MVEKKKWVLWGKYSTYCNTPRITVPLRLVLCWKVSKDTPTAQSPTRQGNRELLIAEKKQKKQHNVKSRNFIDNEEQREQGLFLHDRRRATQAWTSNDNQAHWKKNDSYYIIFGLGHAKTRR